ncbi:hypothetical protein IW140_004743 [Coemansia sp. RSA 1813]|nr:hypothetical protein EV178_004798 [Coemansia sp. RSA 1646]KAJ1771049.1 hypothetical protein LPJ74_002636 [Coemansia sp. RSA 1843]KAJ2087594.1 hypothetical protein IW138_004877 [Coemansia sp. RSA 986]KAJ2212524.1 hypothetical protein EV179_004576 [Coemansia sp. RSA 487]KAJ2566880.1 hypothetical protein IW140_004743 [Coemansia sp. RSA 1813]
MAAQQVPDNWRINVKALMETGSEKTYRVTMPSSETIGVLRNNIATKSQVEAQKQRLIFCGRLLSNDALTLVEVGMSDDCALHMVASRAPGSTPNTGARPHQRQQQQQGSRQRRSASHFMYNMMGRPSELGTLFQQPHLTDSPEEGGDGHARRSFDHTALPLSPLPSNYPINESTPAETFQPIVGFTPIPHSVNIQLPQTNVYLAQNQLQGMSETERLPPTVAQTNELIYDLFTHVLPSIRRHPEREDFHFSTTDSTNPTFITSSTVDQVGSAGGALVNLGDAFTELGRSLREVGHEWQAHNGPSTAGSNSVVRNAYSPVHMQAILLTLTQLLRVSPLAVPFLQSTVADASESRQQTHASTGSTNPISSENGSTRRESVAASHPTSDHGYRDAMSRRIRRHSALVNFVVDTNSVQNHSNTAENPFNGVFGNVGISFLPPIFIEPTFSEHPQEHAGNPERNPNTRTATSNSRDSPSNTDGNTNISRNAESGERSNRANSGGPLGTSRVVHRTMRSIGGNHMIEAIIQQMGIPEPQASADTTSSHVRPPLNVQTTQQNQQQQQQQHQQQRRQNERNSQLEVNVGNINGTHPSGSTASSVSDIDAITPTSADGSNGFYSFLERLRTLGNRNTAQSDRSNASTTTEYSTGNGVSSVRTQRTFAMNGGTLGSPPTHPMNPFSFASMFLGVEPGSTRNTSRRTSLSSNVGGGNDALAAGSTDARAANANSDANGNSNNSISTFGNGAQTTFGNGAQTTFVSGVENGSAVASLSNGVAEPRTGETRPRGSSSCIPDSNCSEGSSTNRSSSGSSKRHKANDVADNSNSS